MIVSLTTVRDKVEGDLRHIGTNPFALVLDIRIRALHTLECPDFRRHGR